MISDLPPATERLVLDSATIDAPWTLVTAFADIVREQPDAVNRAGHMIADRLRAFDVPVTVHEPHLYLRQHRARLRRSVRTALDRYPLAVLGFAQAHLLRGMNHIVAGFTEATAAIDAAVHHAAGG